MNARKFLALSLLISLLVSACAGIAPATQAPQGYNPPPGYYPPPPGGQAPAPTQSASAERSSEAPAATSEPYIGVVPPASDAQCCPPPPPYPYPTPWPPYATPWPEPSYPDYSVNPFIDARDD